MALSESPVTVHRDRQVGDDEVRGRPVPVGPYRTGDAGRIGRLWPTKLYIYILFPFAGNFFLNLSDLRLNTIMGNIISTLFSLIGLNFDVPNSKPKRNCGFLTDVEGNYEYFERYVEISKVLEWANPEKSSLQLKDGAYFVFGGDSQDKGIGDIRFVKMMLALKEKYPDRVFFIIGNRDANKLLLTTELS
jgi:hypothetical protein